MRTAIALVFATLFVAGAHAAPPPHALTDDEFREAATRYAASTKRQVVAWGTLHLDGTTATQRFATLAATGGGRVDPHGPIVCVAEETCVGAYLIEEALGRLWLVSYTDQRWGFTLAFHGPDVFPPPPTMPDWQTLADVAIEHHQSHNKGISMLTFALRDHALVVLEFHDSVRAGDVDEVYAEDAMCHGACPTLAAAGKKGTLSWYIQPIVVGPVARIADLREPRRD